MHELCLIKAWDLLEVCLIFDEFLLRYALDIPEVCLRYIWNIPERYLKYSWYTSEMYLRCTWHYMRYQRVVWYLSEDWDMPEIILLTKIYLVSSWKIPKIWNVTEICLRYNRDKPKEYGICLKFTLDFHRCTWDIPELNLRYTLVIPDWYLRFELDLSKTCQRLTRFSWDIPEMFWLKRLLLEKKQQLLLQ